MENNSGNLLRDLQMPAIDVQVVPEDEVVPEVVLLSDYVSEKVLGKNMVLAESLLTGVPPYLSNKDVLEITSDEAKLLWKVLLKVKKHGIGGIIGAAARDDYPHDAEMKLQIKTKMEMKAKYSETETKVREPSWRKSSSQSMIAEKDGKGGLAMI